MPGEPTGIPGTARPFLRPLSQEPLDRRRGHVSLDDKAFDLRGMTSGEVLGHAETDLHPIHVGRLGDLNWETRLLQVLDPAAAAAGL